MYKFKRPTIVAFMGIPGSGKSTIAYEISNTIDSYCYLECEESEYPKGLFEKFKNVNENENILDIHFYFRNMRAEFHQLAYENKKKNKSTIMDSFFSKLMLDILNEKNACTDCWIDSKSKHFSKIIEISESDSKYLTDADVIIFLNVNKQVHKQFLLKRNRTSEVDESIYKCQDVFLNSTRNYVKKNDKKLILINQEFNLNKIIDSVINQLLINDLICLK